MADWPYNTTQWRKLRLLKLLNNPLCQACEGMGRLTPANTVDHIVAIKSGGAPFPMLTQLNSLCHSCHSAKTARGSEAGAIRSRKTRKGCNEDGSPLDRAHPWLGGNGRLSLEVLERSMPSDLKKSAVPLTIVCGPPGSGKSSYVRKHASADDIVICLDTIMQALSSLPEHHTSVYYLPDALERRNAMLRALATESTAKAAFFIVSAPSPSDRAKWRSRLGGRLHIMETPAVECIRRIKADPSRASGKDRMIKAVVSWWLANPHLETKSLRAAPSRPGPNKNIELVGFGPGQILDDELSDLWG
jgi:predicted kinase